MWLSVCVCACACVAIEPVCLCACVPAARAINKVRACAVVLRVHRVRWCVVRASAWCVCVCARVCVWVLQQRCQLRIATPVASVCDATRTFRMSPCGEHRFRFRARRRCFCKATCVEPGSSRCGGTLVTPGGGSIIFGGAMRSPCGGCGAGGPESAG